MIICLRKQVRFSQTPEDSVQRITAIHIETRLRSVLSSYYTYGWKFFFCDPFHILPPIFYTHEASL